MRTTYYAITFSDTDYRACDNPTEILYLRRTIYYLRHLVTEKTVIMSRGLWDALPQEYKCVSATHYIVVSKDPSCIRKGATVCKSIEEAMSHVRSRYAVFLGGPNFMKEAVGHSSVWFEVVGTYPYATSQQQLLIDRHDWNSHLLFKEMERLSVYSLFIHNRKTDFAEKHKRQKNKELCDVHD